MTLQQIIAEAMENAINNNYYFSDWTYLEIAEDLVMYESNLESEDPHRLISFIQDWYKQSDVTYRPINNGTETAAKA